MPVSVESAITDPFTPNGTTTSFPFTFKAASASEVAVVDQDGTALAGSLYTVTLDDDEGGSVDFAVAPLAADYDAIYVVSAPALTQPSDFGNSGPSFNPSALTRAFDRAVVQSLIQQRRIDGAMRTSVLETLDELPPAAERLNKYLVFDNAGQPDVGDGGGAQGDPGGNVLAIGLFDDAAALTIPAGTDLVQTSGFDTVGVGQAQYAYDAEVDAAYVVANPRTSFVDAGGRGFKLGGGRILTADADGAIIEPFARVPGGAIDASGVAGYTSAGLLVDGSLQPAIDDFVCIDDMRVLGPGDDTGVGIHLKAVDAGEKVTFSRIERTYVDGFYSGLLLESAYPGAGNPTYVNSNHIEAHFYNCVRAVDIRGDTTINEGGDGNRIFSMVQPSAAQNCERAIRDEGSMNIHFNFTWDWNATNIAAGNVNKAVEFVDKGAFRAGMNLLFTNLFPWQVYDANATTERRSIKICYGSVYVGFPMLASAPFTSSFAQPVGNQDDFLVCADKRFTVYYHESSDRGVADPWANDAAPASPTLMFRLGTGATSRSRFTFPAGGQWKRVMVDLGSNHFISGLGAFFQDVNFPETVTLRTSATATADPFAVVWVDRYVDVPGSKFTQPWIYGAHISGQTRWLCFEFYCSGADTVDVERLCAWASAGGRGMAYVATEGGSIYGVINYASATAGDRAIQMNGVKVLGDQGAAVADAAAATAVAPAGGATIDTEARTAIGQLIADNASIRTQLNAALARLRAHGLIAP